MRYSAWLAALVATTAMAASGRSGGEGAPVSVRQRGEPEAERRVRSLGGANVGKFFTAAKRGVQAMGEAPAGERYTVAGKVVSCICARDRFVEGRAQLNTAGMTFLNLDWANRSAATLTCTACGRIEWFLADPEEAV